jgi:hypothetical protein
VVGLVVAVDGDESLERRSRFWVRVVLLVVIPLLGLALVAAKTTMSYRLGGFAWLFFPVMVSLVFAPAALFRRSGPVCRTGPRESLSAWCVRRHGSCES